MITSLRRFRRDTRGATSIEMAGVALVSVVALGIAAKSVGSRLTAEFDRSVGSAFGTPAPVASSADKGKSRPCRAAEERDRPECRMR